MWYANLAHASSGVPRVGDGGVVISQLQPIYILIQHAVHRACGNEARMFCKRSFCELLSEHSSKAINFFQVAVVTGQSARAVDESDIEDLCANHLFPSNEV